MQFFVAGAAFGDVGVSFFLAGAVFGEIRIDSRCAKCCNLQYKMRLRSAKSSLGERAGDALAVLSKFFLDFGVQFCVAGAVFGEVGG